MIKIISDSTCDLSDKLIKQYDIDIVPLSINIEGTFYKDRIDLDTETFYSEIEEYDPPPTTSMPSPMEYIKAFQRAYDEGHKKIICICMSSGTSGSYQSAMIAKEDFLDDVGGDMTIHVLDSIAMSHGSGMLVLKAVKMKEENQSYEAIVSFLEKNKIKVKHFLTVDDLDHLIRSGRLTNASAFIGKILKLKPIMSMKSGKGAIVAKERGRKKVLRHFISRFNERCDKKLTDVVIIGYTSDIKYAENLRAMIQKETTYTGEILIQQMGVVVGTHVGLGGLSMYFFERYHKKDNLLVNEMTQLKEKRDEFLDKIKHNKMMKND